MTAATTTDYYFIMIRTERNDDCLLCCNSFVCGMVVPQQYPVLFCVLLTGYGYGTFLKIITILTNGDFVPFVCAFLNNSCIVMAMCTLTFHLYILIFFLNKMLRCLSTFVPKCMLINQNQSVPPSHHHFASHVHFIFFDDRYYFLLYDTNRQYSESEQHCLRFINCVKY